MSHTLVKTSAVGTTPVMERYVQQNKEWQTFVCAKLTSPIERVLRDLFCAARAAGRQKGLKEFDPIFKLILTKVAEWTDDECAKEFNDPPKEIDACIRMAVRAHAIVMALTISRQCREVIVVPNSQTFFKKVLLDTAGEHNIEVFGSQDFAVRKHLRAWITDNIVKHLLALVPVSIFTEEDDTETVPPDTCPINGDCQAETPTPAAEKKDEPVQIVCDKNACTLSDAIITAPLPSPSCETKEEERAPTPPAAAAAVMPETKQGDSQGDEKVRAEVEKAKIEAAEDDVDVTNAEQNEFV